MHYVGEDFKDLRYEVGPPPAYDKSEWMSDKLTLGLTIPNLPYYKDKDNNISLTQAQAILHYIADKYGMIGVTPLGRAHTLMHYEGIRDWMYAFFDVTYCNAPWSTLKDDVHLDGEEQAISDSPRFDELRTKYLDHDLPRYLMIYSDLLLQSGPWLSGQCLSYADFALYECLDQHLIFSSSCLDLFPALVTYVSTFSKLPEISRYLQSEAFQKEPLHNRYSQFHRGWVK